MKMTREKQPFKRKMLFPCICDQEKKKSPSSKFPECKQMIFGGLSFQ